MYNEPEVYDSSIGPIRVTSNSYCVGCGMFSPFVRLCCKADEDGKAIWTSDHRTINDGVHIYCEHMFMCQHVAFEIANRVRKELIDNA